MNNLRKFQTEADYTAATLNYPSVAWVVSGDSFHFDNAAPPVANDKVIMASYDGSGQSTFIYFNCYASTTGDITSILFNDVEVNPITCQGDEVDVSQTYIVKYTLNTTSVNDWLSGDLGGGAASDASKLDILIPSQITHIEGVPTNTENLVIEATTPPSTSMNQSAFPHPIYVPDSALSAYQNSATWSEWGQYLKPISEYQGNLPV